MVLSQIKQFVSDKVSETKQAIEERRRIKEQVKLERQAEESSKVEEEVPSVAEIEVKTVKPTEPAPRRGPGRPPDSLEVASEKERKKFEKKKKIAEIRAENKARLKAFKAELKVKAATTPATRGEAVSQAIPRSAAQVSAIDEITPSPSTESVQPSQVERGFNVSPLDEFGPQSRSSQDFSQPQQTNRVVRQPPAYNPFGSLGNGNGGFSSNPLSNLGGSSRSGGGFDPMGAFLNTQPRIRQRVKSKKKVKGKKRKVLKRNSFDPLKFI